MAFREGAGSPEMAQAGKLILIGGLTAPVNAQGIVEGDVTAQAHAVFVRLGALLEEAGATFGDVVKHNVYFTCPENQVGPFLAALDTVRAGYFQKPGPVTTEIRCGLERQGAVLMIDAWASGAPREELAPAGHWHWDRTLPFVQGWKVGDMLFIGAQRSLDAKGETIGVDDIEVQTDEAFRNLDTMLKAGGGSRNNLMRQNTFFRFSGQGRAVTDYWEKMTAVRRRYMSVPSAAGAGLRIAGLGHADELIQVEGIAVLGDDKQRLQPEDHWDWSIEGNQFTQGWKIGGFAFIGGQISADNKARAVGRDLETQTRNVFHFIRRTLAEGGLAERDVVRLYIYYHAEGSWAEIEAARQMIARVQREFYAAPGPVVTAIRVEGFAFEDLLIEIEALAVERSPPKLSDFGDKGTLPKKNPA